MLAVLALHPDALDDVARDAPLPPVVQRGGPGAGLTGEVLDALEH